MIGRLIHRLKYGRSKIIKGTYKLSFDELCEKNENRSYGINDITEKGIVVRMGKRRVLLTEDEVFQMFVVTHMLLAEGVEYDR